MRLTQKVRMLLVCLLVLAVRLPAQEFRGTLTGRVTDAQEAVVPGVKVVATQVDTGANYEAVSSGDGQYTIPFLAPGTYRVTAEAAGFKRYVREGVLVSTNQHTGLDLRLEIGAQVETINVTGGSPALETASAVEDEELVRKGRYLI